MRNAEGCRSRLCGLVVPLLYGMTNSVRLRSWLRRVTLRFEAGAMYSLTIRELYRRFHRLDVGLYTIGPCEVGPQNFAPGTSIGRYCSIYYTVRTGVEDPDERHASDAAAPPTPGRRDAAESPGLRIGNDVFIGHNAVIFASTREIGDGAFVGAGSVVRSPVPPYAVVMGNPARVVKYRFSSQTIQSLRASAWWEKSPTALEAERESFECALEASPLPTRTSTAVTS